MCAHALDLRDRTIIVAGNRLGDSLAHRTQCPSILFTNVAVGSLKQFGILVQFVLEQSLPERLLHFTFASGRGLPAIEH